jgi:hypothetical protein
MGVKIEGYLCSFVFIHVDVSVALHAYTHSLKYCGVSVGELYLMSVSFKYLRRRRPDKQCCSLQDTAHYKKKIIVTLYTGSYSVTDTDLLPASDKLFT